MMVRRGRSNWPRRERVAERGRVGTTVRSEWMGVGEGITALQLVIRTSWDPSRGGHGIGLGGESTWWVREASARQQCPRMSQEGRNAVKLWGPGREAGGLLRGVDRGVALSAPRARADALTDRGMRGGGRGVALACSELWHRNCGVAEKYRGSVRGERCSWECRLRLGFRMGRQGKKPKR